MRIFWLRAEGQGQAQGDILEWENFRKGKLASLEKAIFQRAVDEGILPLIMKINSDEPLVTSSSCFGRTVLLEMQEGKGKGDAKFYAKWHSEIGFPELEGALGCYDGKKTLWLRSEPFILHIFAQDLESASGFLQKVRKAGVKRGGIQQLTPRIFLEIIGTSGFALPVYEKKLLVPRDYLKKMLNIANGNMKKNENALARLLTELSKN